MPPTLDQRTSPTLLGRLQQAPADQNAWDEFVDRYAPRIYGWCRRWHLQAADAEDVAQDVLLRLAEKMHSFHYDPSGSFRAWLKTLTHHAWYEFLHHRREIPAGGERIVHALESVEARDDLLSGLDGEFDRELLEEALARVRLRVEPRTWEAFRLTALEGLSGARVAAQLGMPVASVFVARSNVQKRLRREIERLERCCAN